MEGELDLSDIRWLLALNQFKINRDKWINNPNRHLVNKNLVLHLDTLYEVISRFIKSSPHDNSLRRKVFKKLEMLSFLAGSAEVEMGVPANRLGF